MAEQRLREFEAYYGLSEGLIAEATEERLAKIARLQTTGAPSLVAAASRIDQRWRVVR